MSIRPLAPAALVGVVCLAAGSCGGSGSSGTSGTGGSGADAGPPGDPGITLDGSAASGHAGRDGSTDGAADAAACVHIDASSYDRSCQADSDCIPITTGTVCPGCMCPNAAINVKGRHQYFDALLALPPATGICQGACPAGAASCVQGVCAFF